MHTSPRVDDDPRNTIPYHIVFLLFTESNPGGGWWISEDGQDNEGVILESLLETYDQIAEQALSARIFLSACGLNLHGSGVMADIERAFNDRYVCESSNAVCTVISSELATSGVHGIQS